jgi:biopolymer transport protein ExbD
VKIPPPHHSGSMQLKMTPMIDVVFLLLIFFIWTSSFEIPEFDLPSAIASTAAGRAENHDQPPPAEPYDELIVRLTRPEAELRIEINQQPVASLIELRSRLRRIIEIGVQPPVIIDPAAEISMREAVAAYDAARAAGVDRVLFAAQGE